MHYFRAKTWYLLVVSCLLSTALLCSGCAQKAKMIQAGATQFGTESLVAIEKIDTLRRKETETTPLPREEASQLFVQGVATFQGPITLATLRLLLEPLKMNAPESEAQWQAFLYKMRQQYITFAATFTSLDKGSVFAAPAVKKMVPMLDKLVAQMAAFAKSMHDNPAEFIRERAAIAAEIEQVRPPEPPTASKPLPEITRLKLLELERRLRDIVAAEKQITRDTIEQALKAATLGTELRKLLVHYDSLTLDDIAEGLSLAFNLVAGIPGLDISGLKAVTDDLVTKMKAEPILTSFFETAFAEIREVRAMSR